MLFEVLRIKDADGSGITPPKDQNGSQPSQDDCKTSGEPRDNIVTNDSSKINTSKNNQDNNANNYPDQDLSSL